MINVLMKIQCNVVTRDFWFIGNHNQYCIIYSAISCTGTAVLSYTADEDGKYVRSLFYVSYVFRYCMGVVSLWF